MPTNNSVLEVASLAKFYSILAIRSTKRGLVQPTSTASPSSTRPSVKMVRLIEASEVRLGLFSSLKRPNATTPRPRLRRTLATNALIPLKSNLVLRPNQQLEQLAELGTMSRMLAFIGLSMGRADLPHAGDRPTRYLLTRVASGRSDQTIRPHPLRRSALRGHPSDLGRELIGKACVNFRSEH